jgi:hypothetical protein
MKNYFDKNSVWFGILVGTIVPAIMFVIIYFLVYYITLWTNPILIQAYDQRYISNTSVFLIAIMLNIVFFRKYLKDEKYEMTGRGILVITTFLTFVFVALKIGVATEFFN